MSCQLAIIYQCTCMWGGGGNKAYSLHITKNDIYTYIYFKIMISQETTAKNFDEVINL